MMDKGFEKNKPYVLVPISEKPKKERVITHEQFQNLTGKLKLTLTVESEYLFVGSGTFEFNPNSRGREPDVWYTFYRRDGSVCIPGASIKGTIRSIVEAISSSCVSQIARRKGEKIRDSPCRYKKLEDKLCLACRLFGTTGLRGRVSFTDCLPERDVRLEIVKIAELWEPKRPKPMYRRFYKSGRFQHLPNKKPEKNYRFVEAVVKGSVFQTILYFENLTEAELGLIFYAFGWDLVNGNFKVIFTPKLGGAKPRCFGAVKFEPMTLRLLNDSNWHTLLNPKVLEDRELLNFVKSCLRACRKSNLIDEKSWKILANGLKPKDEPCPRGNY